MKKNELVMELTGEQGPGRESQVQPPKPVWEQFFGVRIDSTNLPTFRFENMQEPGGVEQRKVVKHHHNFTIEISGAKVARPAIIRIQRQGVNSFGYWIYRERSKDYEHCKWVLQCFDDNNTERKWVIINPQS